MTIFTKKEEEEIIKTFKYFNMDEGWIVMEVMLENTLKILLKRRDDHEKIN